MLATVFTLVGMAGASMAFPALQMRQTGASCSGLGTEATDTSIFGFTLTAYSTTDQNTTYPLVLAWGPPGDSPAASEWVYSVRLYDSH